MPYVFYDIETTGLNVRFDQIIQFAAIYTDEEFNERDRINFKCKIQPNLIPSIEAIVINKTSLQQLTDNSRLSHYEMILAICEKLRNWSPATFVGWNTIRFDEEFLRSAFYQNLLPPFLTNTNGNSRFDALQLARAASIFKPDSINIPISIDGNKEFSLKKVAAANGFTNQYAHDALNDVLATIHISKLLKQVAREVWSLGNRFSNKQTVLDSITSDNPAIAVVTDFGQSYCYPFIKIGEDPKISGNLIVADLRFDFSRHYSLSDLQKHEWLFQNPPPIHKIKCNASPVFIPLDELEEFEDYNFDKLSMTAEQLASNQQLCEELTDVYLTATHKEFPNKFVEEQIYTGFPDSTTKEHLVKFHQVPWHDRHVIISNINDKRFKKLGLRLLGEHASSCLSQNQVEALAKFARIRKYGFPDEQVPWRTLTTAQLELSNFQAQQVDAANNIIIKSYEEYLIDCL